jgi:hypothetical protein
MSHEPRFTNEHHFRRLRALLYSLPAELVLRHEIMRDHCGHTCPEFTLAASFCTHCLRKPLANLCPKLLQATLHLLTSSFE